MPWFSRPISVAFLLAGIIMICLPIIRTSLKRKKEEKAAQ